MINYMSKITSSASKLVLLYIVFILGMLALVAGIFAVVTNNFAEASKTILELFGSAVTFVLGFYFGYKGDTTPVVTPTNLTPDEQATLQKLISKSASGFGK